MAPLVLGIVLGDLLDKNLRRGLVLSDGDLSPFFTRPISFVMFCLVAATILMNIPAFTDGRQPPLGGARRGLCAAASRRCLSRHADIALQRGDRRVRLRAAMRVRPARSAMTGSRSRPCTLSTSRICCRRAPSARSCAGMPPMPASRSPACIICCVRRQGLSITSADAARARPHGRRDAAPDARSRTISAARVLVHGSPAAARACAGRRGRRDRKRAPTASPPSPRPRRRPASPIASSRCRAARRAFRQHGRGSRGDRARRSAARRCAP